MYDAFPIMIEHWNIIADGGAPGIFFSLDETSKAAFWAKYCGTADKPTMVILRIFSYECTL